MSLKESMLPVFFTDVNSDHVVIDGPLDASRPIVSTLRHHPEFPRGTNVNMVEQRSDDHLEVATFERGVEAITGACGTGAIACALRNWRANPAVSTVRITPPSGRDLTVSIEHDGDTVVSIDLTGDAVYDEERS